MGKTMSDMECPFCGSKLEDVGNYKWDCPNGCFPLAFEAWQIEDMNGLLNHEAEEDS